ncbi:methionyl-tRNA formyltransferase [Aquirhabdus parva]|uniref:Methionyl-tRNA formyltransferase n=1 Tax=Aquirhabdus parva TaxID=2283318 RepID=A0A345P8Q5_9GAMM|nr:methionyl-tRNA formyltransferase [Aquirhabdus parva]AXI03664.1 methionyl-tRNA formyltransferase [Aquirhabdus parva]
MNLIFAGTPEFAATALQALIDAGHHIVAVYTQPDRPSGRGQKLTPSAVKALALEHNLPVYQPVHLKASTTEGLAAQAELAALVADHQVDVMVVAAYGLILPQSVLDMPRLGCLNIHASLLPRWRGAAPIHRAILSGDTETGITIMQMDAGLDTGDMLSKVHLPIDPKDTSATLHDRLAVLGGSAIVDTLAHLADYHAHRTPQASGHATYAAKLSKAEGKIDWSCAAIVLDRLVRGLQPWPVAYTQIGEDILRVWSAELVHDRATHTAALAGEIIAVDKHGISVVCGDGQVLRLTQLQWAGGKPLNSVQILQAQKLSVGQQLQ